MSDEAGAPIDDGRRTAAEPHMSARHTPPLRPSWPAPDCQPTSETAATSSSSLTASISPSHQDGSIPIYDCVSGRRARLASGPQSKNTGIRISEGSSSKRRRRGERAWLLIRANNGNGGHAHFCCRSAMHLGCSSGGSDAIERHASSSGDRTPATERNHCTNGTHALRLAHGTATGNCGRP